MTAEQSSLLAHPLFLTTLGVFCAGIGWAVTTLISLIKDNGTLTQTAKQIKELLDHVVNRQDKTDELIEKISSELNRLQGEHTAMMRAGNMIEHHDFKKKHSPD